MAIRQPGMFLSQPGMVISPSYHCAPMTVSIESAIRSRDWSEYDIPSVPMEMPSDTPMVLKRRPTSPAALTPSLTLAARSFRCMLQVLPSHQLLTMPTSALTMSADVSPVPYSMAWDAPWLFGSVMREL